MMNIICDLSTYNGKIPDPDKIIQLNGNDIELCLVNVYYHILYLKI